MRKSEFKPEKLWELALQALEQRQDDLAEGKMLEIVNVYPAFAKIPVVLLELGNLARQRKQYDVAQEYYQRAIAQDPGFFHAHNNLGMVFGEQGRMERAIQCFQAAIHINPEYATGFKNLALVHRQSSRLIETVEFAEKYMRLIPGDKEMMRLLADVYLQLDILDKAKEWYEKIIRTESSSCFAYSGLGGIFTLTGEYSAAFRCLREALQIEPDDAESYNLLGRALLHTGHHAEAAGAYEKAFNLAKRPEDRFVLFSNRLLATNYVEGIEPADMFRMHREYNDLFMEVRQYSHLQRSRKDKIRIAYLSRDFRNHSVAYFILGILSAHDRSQFEVFCYSDVERPDVVTRQLRAMGAFWRDTSKMTHQELADTIYSDQIDILVDLAGHAGNNRLPVFAMKPAPIQVTWIGYPNTTGLEAMDYRLTDEYADPTGISDPFYTEQLIRLPESFLCFAASEEADRIDRPPVDPGQPITFGCFNNFAKITDELLLLWKLILEQTPGSRIVVKSKVMTDAKIRDEAEERLLRLGFESGRVLWLPWEKTREGHLSQYNQIDIALDTFPYNGATTTCEALYMGVPVVTLVGQRHASRVGLSLLSNVGLAECIAWSDQEYVDKAVALAKDQSRLSEIRSSLRQKMRSSPLMNVKNFVDNLERAYREMYRVWCAKIELAAYCDGLYREVVLLLKEVSTQCRRDSFSEINALIARTVEKIYILAAAEKEKTAAQIHAMQEINRSLEDALQLVQQQQYTALAHCVELRLEPALSAMFDSTDKKLKREDLPERRLHIGGKVRQSGWEVFNAVDGEYVDHLGNAADLSRFVDDTFSMIYASHVLEHFDYIGEFQAVLKEWRRVLVPNGRLYISVPDLEILAGLLTRSDLTTQERFHVMRMIFGGHTDAYDYHKVGLTFDILSNFLMEAGFDNVTKVKEFQVFPDTSNLLFKDVAISLNIVASKGIQTDTTNAVATINTL